MEEPTTKASGKTPRKASPKPPPPAAGKGQAKRAEPKPNQAKKTSAATTATARRSAAIRAVPEHPRSEQAKPAPKEQAKPAPRERAKPAPRDQKAGGPGPERRKTTGAEPEGRQATGRVAGQPIKAEPVPLVQMEIELPDGAVRVTSITPEEPTPTLAPPPPSTGAARAVQTEPTVRAEPTVRVGPTERAEAIGGEQRQGDPAAREIPLWAHLVADPGFAPEHIARGAIRELGPRAAAWVDRTRGRYPNATPDAIARLAAREFTREAGRAGAASAGASWAGAALAGAGLGGVVAAGTVVARTQARLVLTIAAAYGLDPTAEERVRELLTLLRVPRLTEPTKTALLNVARLLAGVTVCRAAARVVPFGSAVAGALQANRATAGVALRAIARYRRMSVTAG